MKILYIAFACNPYVGSEAFCGWSWPLAMRKYCEVYVVTRKENRAGIEKYLNEHKINDIHFFYYDIPDAINIYYKLGKMYMPYSVVWQNTSFRFIKKLHKKYNFEFIHQVTLGDFRIVNPAWKLNSKFIFGPVGGAQLTPESLKSYTLADKKTEQKRKYINQLMVSLPQYKNALKHIWLVLAANRETQEYLCRYIRNMNRCDLLTENGVTQEQLHDYRVRPVTDSVVLLWAGRMIPRKGLSFLLDVLKIIKSNNNFILRLVGDGPEMENLKKKVNALKIEDKVDFAGSVPYKEMKKIYLSSDVFVFPSLRETTGTVLFEAMSNGLPIVTFDQNGAALLVTDSCGLKVNIHQTVDDIKREFADKLRILIDSPLTRSKMARNAYLHVVENYTWTAKCKIFYENYLR